VLFAPATRRARGGGETPPGQPAGRQRSTCLPHRRNTHVPIPAATNDFDSMPSAKRSAGVLAGWPGGVSPPRTRGERAAGSLMYLHIRGRNAMCRNIKTLFNFEPPATDDEIRDASLQFVRKLSGFTKPSKANEIAFNRAVADIAAVAETLIASLVTTAEPRDREIEAERARRRSAERFG
jgi:hypothetical protein